jgi:hypothetical protein
VQLCFLDLEWGLALLPMLGLLVERESPTEFRGCQRVRRPGVARRSVPLHRQKTNPQLIGVF